MREVVVPPEKRILNVEVMPSTSEYKPGQKAKVKVKLTDLAGKPFVGSTVVAIYDKSASNTSPAAECAGDQGVLLEVAAASLSADRVEPGATGSATCSAEERDRHGRPRRLRRHGGRGSRRKTASGKRHGEGTAGGSNGNCAARRRAGGMGGRARARSWTRCELHAGKESDEGRDRRASGEPNAPAAAEPAPAVEPTVRKNFADTAFWVGALTTDKDGTAEVALDMPENLTTWKIKVWGMGHGTKVGQGEAEVVTRKDLIVRLQAPRFFVAEGRSRPVGHRPQLSEDEEERQGVAGTGRRHARAASARLDADGRRSPPAARTASIGASRSSDEGEAVVRMKALTDEESDAMEMQFPVLRPRHAQDGFLLRRRSARQDRAASSRSACPTSGASTTVAARSPLFAHPGRGDGRRPAVPGRLSLRLHRADAQPLPADGHHAEGPAGHEARPEGDPRRSGRTSTPRKSATTRSGPSSGSAIERNPVFDEDEVRQMVKDGVERLTEMQSPTAAGAGSPAGASIPGRTPRPWWSTACKSPRQNDVALRARHARTRRRVAEALPGRAGPADSRTPREPRPDARGRSTPTTSTPSSTWCWSTPA